MLEFRRCGWLPARSRFRSSSDAAAGSQPHAGGLGSDAAMNVCQICTCGCLRAIALSQRIQIYSLSSLWGGRRGRKTPPCRPPVQTTQTIPR